METAIFSVFYPGAEPYIPDFLQSLSKQTDDDFILFLINNGCNDIGRFFRRIDFPVKVLEQNGQPAELRKAGIQWITNEGLEVIIFADADDYFAENRVEISKKMLVDYDLICNEILLVGEIIPQPIPMLGEFLKDRMEINPKHIMSGNFLGLSNSSIRVDKISSLTKNIPDDVVAFDWAFFALCLHAGAKAIFTSNTQTYYRQHGDNIASPCSFSEDQILRGIRVKRDHYRLLLKFYNEYNRLANAFERLHSHIQSDILFKEKYCESVRSRCSAVPIWWEPIKTREELGL